ncbi:hypothetical protein [Acinetobacter pseudolwoffii]|uniref:Uncharacterized protein n=1 Tax=Acinetobacter pseudolwoffii TaxID=2053287 RepID=A0A2H9UI74_9GAMM|nr:hypothetical protein [Acinetobacter pseudolwoffii]MCO8092407.1 hypothetical protein [Acinetobacter pseudolwoffii]PJI31387.1 hypothetical protein CU320_14135 [Acinetobacter pseudolwoffii]
MKVNYDLVNHLINNNIKSAVEYFKSTEDSQRLRNQIDFSVQQIIVCLNSDTVLTIQELLKSLRLESALVDDNKGWLKAIAFLDDKYKF